MNKLYIITGPAGVGKSTISMELAKHLKKSVLIEGDDIYNQFISDRISPWKDNAPLELFWNNCICLINNYLKNGYNVVFNYIIKKSELEQLKKSFIKYNIVFTLLLVDEETLIKRDKTRAIDCQMGERSLILLRTLKNEKFDKKYILDNSKISPIETCELIINDEKFELK